MTIESLERVDHRTAFDFYTSRFSNVNDFQFIFVGNITKEQLQPFIETYIATLPKGKPNTKLIDRGITYNKVAENRVIHRGNDDKTTVSMIYPSDFQLSFKDQSHITALNTILFFMLFENIREEMSGVYYIQPMPNIQGKPNPQIAIQINFGCSPERVDELVAAVEEQLRMVINNEFDVKYLSNFKMAFRSMIEPALKTNDYWASQLDSMFGRGSEYMKADDILNFLATVEKLTAKEIADIAKKYIDFSKRLMVVLYPEVNEE